MIVDFRGSCLQLCVNTHTNVIIQHAVGFDTGQLYLTSLWILYISNIYEIYVMLRIFNLNFDPPDAHIFP